MEVPRLVWKDPLRAADGWLDGEAPTNTQIISNAGEGPPVILTLRQWIFRCVRSPADWPSQSLPATFWKEAKEHIEALVPCLYAELDKKGSPHIKDIDDVLLPLLLFGAVYALNSCKKGGARCWNLSPDQKIHATCCIVYGWHGERIDYVRGLWQRIREDRDFLWNRNKLRFQITLGYFHWRVRDYLAYDRRGLIGRSTPQEEDTDRDEWFDWKQEEEELLDDQ